MTEHRGRIGLRGSESQNLEVRSHRMELSRSCRTHTSLMKGSPMSRRVPFVALNHPNVINTCATLLSAHCDLGRSNGMSAGRQ